jgi:hypothetical protein
VPSARGSLSAAIAAGAVTFNWLAHPNRLAGGFFAGMSLLGYLVWLTHAENSRRGRLRALGDLPPTTPAYEIVGHWLRHPWLTRRARSLAKANPAFGRYDSLAAAPDQVRAERRRTAIAKVLHRKIRAAVGPTTADIAVAVYDLDVIADRLADQADYDGLTALVAADLAPARLAAPHAVLTHRCSPRWRRPRRTEPVAVSATPSVATTPASPTPPATELAVAATPAAPPESATSREPTQPDLPQSPAGQESARALPEPPAAQHPAHVPPWISAAHTDRPQLLRLVRPSRPASVVALPLRAAPTLPRTNCVAGNQAWTGRCRRLSHPDQLHIPMPPTRRPPTYPHPWPVAPGPNNAGPRQEPDDAGNATGVDTPNDLVAEADIHATEASEPDADATIDSGDDNGGDDEDSVPQETAAAVAYWYQREPGLHPRDIAARIGRSERTVRRYWPPTAGSDTGR